MKKVQTYEIETEELQDNSRMGKIGAIVRLLAMAAVFVLCIVLAVQDLLKGKISVIGDLMGSVAVPSLIWMYVKACCLATPIVKAIWKWVIPLTIVAFLVKIMICIALFGLPGLFYLEYVMSPIVGVIGGGNTFLAVLVMIVLAVFTALFAWIDICKLMGRSAIETIKSLFAKKSA